MKAFEIIQHSTDAQGRKIVLIRGEVFSHEDTVKLRSELNCLLDYKPAIAPTTKPWINKTDIGETDILIVTYRNCTALLRGAKRQFFTGGRVACKREAKRLHEETGCRVFNQKKGGFIVQVHPEVKP